MTGAPRHLPALLRWYRQALEDEVPVRIHSRETAEDGDPEWHASFRSWLLAPPAATDREGHVKYPLRFWLYTMRNEGRSGRVMATFLFRLAAYQGDWLAAVRAITPLTDDGEVIAHAFAVKTLVRIWALMQSEPRPSVRKSEAQHVAEEAA